MYLQKGFGLKAEVSPVLARTYQSPVVERLKLLGYDAHAGDLRLKLAREFGFCYGVDRAVEYAYETHRRFPGRRIFLSGEIIHNPEVNSRLRAMGIQIVHDAPEPLDRYADIHAGDVMILPAFGVTVAEMNHLRDKGCVLVDTTCGSVLNVWKMVHRCARDGFTVVIHGKHYHEETRATASQTRLHQDGQYLCVRNAPEAARVCAFIRQEMGAAELLANIGPAVSAGFDPERHLTRVGFANQTTMLMAESLEIQEMLRLAMRDRYGEAELANRFRAFDTICSATQDRQDAVTDLLAAGGLDLMIVIGGYKSSNTQALAAMCGPVLPTFHIEDADCVTASAIRHRPLGGGAEVTTDRWMSEGEISIGITSGASTPDSVVGAVIERLLALRQRSAGDLAEVESNEGRGNRRDAAGRSMSGITGPTELRITLAPQRRFEAIDVNMRIAEEAGDVLHRHERALYCSFHTTAGYLDQSLSARLRHDHGHVSKFFGTFHALFPEGAEYRHDKMELRTELSDEQKEVEPRNGDSHLTFIGAGLRNCVTYQTRPDAPVYFVDLDGTCDDVRRQRTTAVVAYDHEQVVVRTSVTIPVSKHPIDSVNLADAGWACSITSTNCWPAAASSADGSISSSSRASATSASR